MERDSGITQEKWWGGGGTEIENLLNLWFCRICFWVYVLWVIRCFCHQLFSLECMSSVNLLLYKLQSGLCGQLLCSLITGEEEGEKMTKAHDYPKGGE